MSNSCFRWSFAGCLQASISAETFCLVGVPSIFQATLVVFTEMNVGINDIIQQNLHGCEMTSRLTSPRWSEFFPFQVCFCYAGLHDYV